MTACALLLRGLGRNQGVGAPQRQEFEFVSDRASIGDDDQAVGPIAAGAGAAVVETPLPAPPPP